MQLIQGISRDQIRFSSLEDAIASDNQVRFLDEAGIGITLLPTELILKHYSYRSLHLISLPRKFSKCPTQFIKRKDYPIEEIHRLFFNSIINGYKTVS